MSFTAVDRGFRIVQFLATKGEARFKDFLTLLKPISRTTLSKLLSSLEEIRQIEHTGRIYRLSPASIVLHDHDYATYTLSPALQREVQPAIKHAATRTGHSCALFARVGASTMKIMAAHNLGHPHWSFSPIGYEWPLVPFHSFAQILLAYSSDLEAKEAFSRWQPSLLSICRSENDQLFRAKLQEVRQRGYSVEYREEVSNLMRIAVPVRLPGEAQVRFAVGIAANFVYLIESKKCVETLRATANELAGILAGKVPKFHLEEIVGDTIRTRAGPRKAKA